MCVILFLPAVYLPCYEPGACYSADRDITFRNAPQEVSAWMLQCPAGLQEPCQCLEKLKAGRCNVVGLSGLSGRFLKELFKNVAQLSPLCLEYCIPVHLRCH